MDAIVAIDATGAIGARAVCPDLPEVPRGAPIVLAIANPSLLATTYASVVSRGGVPLFVHSTLPLASARRLAEGVGAAALVHAPLRGESRVETLDVPRATLPEGGHLLCTSGTTGPADAAKVFYFPRERALANARAHLSSLGLGGVSGLRIALPMPLSHAFGLVAGLFAAEASRSTLFAFASTPDPATLLDVAARESIDVLHLTPPLARLLARSHARRAPRTLPALRVVGVGSAPTCIGDLRALQRLSPSARVVATYGLTECGPRVATFDAGSAEAPSPALGACDASPVGLGAPLEGVELSVEEVGEDGVGELVVRTPYQATASLVDRALVSLESDGFRTRDAARRGESGAITLLGRLDGTICRGGTNVYPANVEPVAETVPGVRAACVIGQPSALYGEVPVLVCELEPGADAPSVHAALEARFEAVLTPTDRPVEIRFVEDMPRTSLGKIVRRAVAGASAARCEGRR